MSPHRDPLNAYLLRAVREVVAGNPRPDPGPDLDWRRHAARHGVLALLDAAPSAPGTAPGDRAAVEAHLFSVAAQLELSMDDLTTVARALDGTGLRWAVFKGPVLGHDVYRDPLTRWFTDLDVLVAPEDFGTALAALEQAGGTLLDRNWGAARRLQVRELSVRMPRGTTVDLHWHVCGRPERRARLSLSTQDLLARTRQVRLGRLTAPTLDELDTVLHLTVHAADSGAGLLRWLVDLRQALVRYDPDPAALRDRARQQGTALIAELMIGRAADHVDPTLNRYRGRLAPHDPTAVAGRLWSRAFPPGRGLSGRAARTGQALYFNAGPDGRSTAALLLAQALRSGPRWLLRPQRSPWSAQNLPSRTLRLPVGEQREERDAYLESIARHQA